MEDDELDFAAVRHVVEHDGVGIGGPKFGADLLQTFGFDIVRMEGRFVHVDRDLP